MKNFVTLTASAFARSMKNYRCFKPFKLCETKSCTTIPIQLALLQSVSIIVDQFFKLLQDQLESVFSCRSISLITSTVAEEKYSYLVQVSDMHKKSRTLSSFFSSKNKKKKNCFYIIQQKKYFRCRNFN